MSGRREGSRADARLPCHAQYRQPAPLLPMLTDEAEHGRALAYLTSGKGYQLTLHDESTRYVLLAYPAGATS